jgi:hypothetical protein
MIMPLANKRDQLTQGKWGIYDFENRFGRSPEGIWLPETAVNIATLEIIASLKIKFTILSPKQAHSFRKIGSKEWIDVSMGNIDTKKSYLCNLPSGKKINVFFYDQPISHDIAFGGLLNDAEVFVKRLTGAFYDNYDSPQLVNIATDGETFGHHHRFGDMALSYCLDYIDSNTDVKLTNYGEYLEKFPPIYEVKIIENTSWSCVHGTDRWKKDCGCNTGKESGWSQEWRSSLRQGMDWLGLKLNELFEIEGPKYFKNHWKARDRYIAVILNRSKKTLEDFLLKNQYNKLSDQEIRKALKLLEIQRNGLLSYTSCGWFFDDISEISALQVLKYASRSIQLTKELTGSDLEPEYLEFLKDARSNNQNYKTGEKIFAELIKPASIDLMKVGIHYAISSLFDHGDQKISRVYSYILEDEILETYQIGRRRLIIGRSIISSEITNDIKTICFAVLWLGDHNVIGGLKELIHFDDNVIHEKIKSSFEKADITATIKLIDEHHGKHSYSLKDLFIDEQRKIIQKILSVSIQKAESNYRQIYEDNYPALSFLVDNKISIPKSLQVAADVIITSEIRRTLKSERIDLKLLDRLINAAMKYSINLDDEVLSLEMCNIVEAEIEKLFEEPDNIELLEYIEFLVRVIGKIPVNFNLWRSQNIIYSIGRKYYHLKKEKEEKGDDEATKWLKLFNNLTDQLKINIM